LVTWFLLYCPLTFLQSDSPNVVAISGILHMRLTSLM
jgi:hypothetical protein